MRLASRTDSRTSSGSSLYVGNITSTLSGRSSDGGTSWISESPAGGAAIGVSRLRHGVRKNSTVLTNARLSAITSGTPTYQAVQLIELVQRHARYQPPSASAQTAIAWNSHSRPAW